jgi:hypothetical protein
VRAKAEVAFAKLDLTKPFSRGAQSEIRKAIDIEVPSDGLKLRGRDYLVEKLAKDSKKTGEVKDAIAAFDRLITQLQNLGVVVYPEGALEAFSAEDLPKEGWTDRVLARDLSTDTKLDYARKFANLLVGAVRAAIEK